MKIRTGFVSNSSSSSFCIWKGFMTPKQIEKFREVLSEHDPNDRDYYDTSIGESGVYFIGTLDQHDEKVMSYIKSLGLKREQVGDYC